MDLTEPPIDFDRRTGFGSTRGILGLASPDSGGGLYRVSALDEPPERVSAPEPRYPDLLLRAGIEGAVVVEVVIDTAGHPEPASVRVLASDHRAFTAAAREAVLASRYRPGRTGGRAVRVLVRIPVRFVIGGS